MTRSNYRLGIVTSVIKSILGLIYAYSIVFVDKRILINYKYLIPLSVINGILLYSILMSFYKSHELKTLVIFLTIIFCLSIFDSSHLYLAVLLLIDYDLSLGIIIEYSMSIIVVFYSILILFSRLNDNTQFKIYGVTSLSVGCIILTSLIMDFEGKNYLLFLSAITPLAIANLFYFEIKRLNKKNREVENLIDN